MFRGVQGVFRLISVFSGGVHVVFRWCSGGVQHSRNYGMRLKREQTAFLTIDKPEVKTDANFF